MKSKYNLTEGSKWKELARQGKLSQKDFDTLKTSSAGKKYLNPRYIMKNKERGQNAELEKLLKKTGWTFDMVRDVDFNPRTMGNPANKHIEVRVGPTPANYRDVMYISSSRPTALQRAGIKAHEKDEAIQALKAIKLMNNDYNTKQLKIAASHYNNKPFKFTKSQQKHSKKLEKELRNIKSFDDTGLLSPAALRVIHGYGHFPGVLNREFELRNLLYPSYRTSSKKKSQSFSGGKYTVYNLLGGKVIRVPDEIEYGKMTPRKQAQMIGHNKKVLANQVIKNETGMNPRIVFKK